MLMFIWMAGAMSVKRMHDIFDPEGDNLLYITPGVGKIASFFHVAFKRGVVGPNRYGPDPLQDPRAIIGVTYLPDPDG